MEDVTGKRKPFSDSELPLLYREKVVITTFVVFYLSMIALVVNVLILCPCCFLAHFTLCCPTCQMFPITLSLLSCTVLFVVCLMQTRPIFDPKFMEREIVRRRKLRASVRNV